MSFLIAIEGIDGSGKGTQATRLCETLRHQGLRVGLLSFPRYEATRFGRAIADFLNGRFGTLQTVHPQLAALLFAGDRFESRSLIETTLAENDVVICDRYVASNVAHQAAKLPESQRSELMAWIESIEFDVYALPRPDLTLLLDLPATLAQELVARKAARHYTEKAADLHEADTGYLQQVRNVYRQLAAGNATWRTTEICGESGIRSITEIATEIAGLVGDALPPTGCSTPTGLS